MSDTIDVTDGWVSLAAGGEDKVRLQVELRSSGQHMAVHLDARQLKRLTALLLQRATDLPIDVDPDA